MATESESSPWIITKRVAAHEKWSGAAFRMSNITTTTKRGDGQSK